MVVAEGTDIFPLGVADLVVETDHDPAPLALRIETAFFEPLLIPPVNPFAGLLGESDVVERKGHIERIQSRGEFPGQAGFAELFGVFALVGAVDAAKILFPKGVPSALDVGGRADRGSPLTDPKIGGDDVSP